jgi:hypothetical protein
MQKAALKGKKLRTQINGKLIIKVSLMKINTQNITVEPLFKTYKNNTFIHR